MHNFEYGPCPIWINSIFPNAMDPNSRTYDSNSVGCHTPKEGPWISSNTWTTHVTFVEFIVYYCPLLDVGYKLRPIHTPVDQDINGGGMPITFSNSS